ncbi:unnamed protein product [Merluccius merluccius]
MSGSDAARLRFAQTLGPDASSSHSIVNLGSPCFCTLLQRAKSPLAANHRLRMYHRPSSSKPPAAQVMRQTESPGEANVDTADVETAQLRRRAASAGTWAGRTTGRTGVEMEALTAAAVAALTLYDMCKAVSHDIIITEVRLLHKTGGKRDFHHLP